MDGSKIAIIIALITLVVCIFSIIISLIAAYYINLNRTINVPTNVITDTAIARANNGLMISDGSVVYYVANNELHKFSNSTIANAYGETNISNTISNIKEKIAMGSEISTIPIPLVAYEGKIVGCSNGDPLFYIQNGKKRWIPNAAALAKINAETVVVDCAMLWAAGNDANMP